MVKLNPTAVVPFRQPGGQAPASESHVMDPETNALVERWIIAFREPPVLIDPELMRRMLAEAESPSGRREP